MKTSKIAVLGALLIVGLVRAQTVKPKPAVAVKPVPIAKAVPAAPTVTTAPADGNKPIPLTPEEGKDLEIAQLKSQNLQLQIEKLQTQVQQAQQKTTQEMTDLNARLVKAHDIDITKYRLDTERKEFVPLPPVAKPAAK